MRTLPALLLTIGLLTIGAQTALAGERPASLSANELQTWSANLGSSEFRLRQGATGALIAAGAPAVPIVARAFVVGDRETRDRAVYILQHLALEGSPAARTAAEDALAALVRGDDRAAARKANAVLQLIVDARVLRAVEELDSLGATISPDDNARGPFTVQIPQMWKGGDDKVALLSDLRSVNWLSCENAPIGDKSLVYIARQTELERLFLGSTRITGAGLAQLAPLDQLKYLSLKQLPIDDAALARLPEFPQLTNLGLDYTRITDAGLVQLKRYPQLQTLWLDHTSISDVGLANLVPLQNLRTLFLPATKVTGPGLDRLSELPNLNYLSLKECQLGPGALKKLGQVKQLETLGLDHTNVSDDQLADLQGLNKLRILWLSKTPISDAGLKHLESIGTLQMVYLHGSKVTDDGYAALRKALPNCQVQY
jgi:hypothetical protein